MYGDLEEEFRRYAKIVSDPETPAEILIIYLSRSSDDSKELFVHLAQKYDVPTKTIIREWTP